MEGREGKKKKTSSGGKPTVSANIQRCQKIRTPGLKLHMRVFLRWGVRESNLSQIPARGPGRPPVLLGTCSLSSSVLELAAGR